jgi:hypothetical protein
MLQPIPQRIEVRKIGAQRRISAPRLIRRRVDADCLRTVLRSGSYATLLNPEVLAEEASDALRAGDDAAVASVTRAAAELITRAGPGEDVSQKSALPVAKIVAKRGGRLPGETFDLIKFDAKGRPTDGAGEWRCELHRPTQEDAK